MPLRQEALEQSLAASQQSQRSGGAAGVLLRLEDLELLKPLGEGSFGEVFKARLTRRTVVSRRGSTGVGSSTTTMTTKTVVVAAKRAKFHAKRVMELQDEISKVADLRNEQEIRR